MAHSDIDYIADAGDAILARQSHGGRLILLAVALLLATLLGWAAWAELDEVVRGQGRVIPSGQVQVVQNLEGGIVKEILVAEGDRVEPDQVLLRIDDTRFGANLRETRVRSLTLRVQAARLAAEAAGGDAEPEFPADVLGPEHSALVADQRRLFAERKAQLQASLAVLEQQREQRRQQISELKNKARRAAASLDLAQKELRLTRPLQAEGAISAVEVLRLERQVNDLRGDLEQARLGIPRAQAELGETEQRMAETRAEFRQQAGAEFSRVNAELAELEAGNVAIEDRVRRTTVRAPARGVVKKLMVNTPGGVVQPGMDLVEIVPLDDSLLVEARVRPRDIAFLSPDLEATVKLTAYDFAIYGGLAGRLEHISADTFEDEEGNAYYLAKVRTAESMLRRDGRALPIIPGMTAEVDILTGKRTVLDYLLKPVLRARANALREP